VVEVVNGAGKLAGKHRGLVPGVALNLFDHQAQLTALKFLVVLAEIRGEIGVNVFVGGGVVHCSSVLRWSLPDWVIFHCFTAHS